jgi:hypothetical protein
VPDQIRPGLWRWTAPHPAWQPTDDWPREVGCVLYETARDAVFIDALAPAGDPSFWAWADEHARGREVSLLETIVYHRRSREEFVTRYDADTRTPDHVAALPLDGFPDTLFWIAEHRVLVAGDCLIGTGGGEVSLCPASWLADLDPGRTLSELRRTLSATLAGLDVELVLVSHGEPTLRDGADALAAALRAT